MSRIRIDRRALALLVLALVAVAAMACRGREGGAKTVVLVTIDTLRTDRLGCYGRKDAGTPRLDALAAGGTRFTAAHTTAPITLPAHATILTGRTLPAHKVVSNGSYSLPKGIPTVAGRFQKAGYATGAFVSSKVLSRRHRLNRGFELYDATMPPREDPGAGFLDERPGSQTVDHALAWLAGVKSKPAFLWVHLWEPHTPYSPPAEFAQRFAADPYQGEIAAADAALGKLLDGLKAAGREDCLVLVAGDHGEALGEHDEETHGMFLYQATMSVPLVVWGPSFGVRAGGVVDDVVSLTDVAPTLIDVAGGGVAPLPWTDGLSLAPVLRGTGSLAARDGVMAESHLPSVEFGWSGLRAIVRGRTKMIEAPRPELYDLGSDPGEARDLAAQRPADVASGRTAIADALRRAIAAAPEESAAGTATAEDLEALRALGYVASGRRSNDAPDKLVDPRRVDPKDKREFIFKFERAITLSQSGRAAEAAPLFDQLEQLEPNSIALMLEKGNGLIAAQQYDKALEVFRRAVGIAPDFSVAWHRIGHILERKSDAAGAEAAYRRALESDASNVMTMKALAALFGKQGRDKEAIGLLERIVKLDPSDQRSARELEQLRAKAPRT